ncbi:MAG: hypothetical protein FD157_1590 [Rhodocyclaceae bacterium]|nr:MAG: hypothetical protein FD157_1590 [Rhodocyclaceae bacterium]
MRVYHFVPQSYGIENLKLRRLKVATIHDLNDPFELLCIDLSNPDLRHGMLEWKAEVARRFGMLCFSLSWRNPVQWSHYADKHRGLCLAFDVPDDSMQPVTYSGLRSRKEAFELLEGGISTLNETTMKKFLSTKYAHWHYEKEVRAFLRLNERDPATQLYFTDFSDKLKLVEVIVGSESDLTRQELNEVLGTLAPTTSLRKARLAFKSFRVTTQQDKRLWG